MNRNEIFEKVVAVLVGTFNLDPAKVTADAHLVNDLDLDSIDAIDMAVQLQELTKRRVEEAALREVRTVGDVVALVEAHLTQAS